MTKEFVIRESESTKAVGIFLFIIGDVPWLLSVLDTRR